MFSSLTNFFGKSSFHSKQQELPKIITITPRKGHYNKSKSQFVFSISDLFIKTWELQPKIGLVVIFSLKLVYWQNTML